LVLSDGTKVWLNSVSSIHYPTAFVGKERIVDITGEVYFEVMKNRAMPFKVMVNGMQVEVLGTHFNINSYEDEANIKTTLIEGLVKIVNNRKASFLKPGQQAILRLRIGQDEKREMKIVDNADIEEVVSWKKGLFRFQKADIKTIMRQVSRWYDVEVEYEKEVTETFSGTIPRNVTVSKLFAMLELTGHVHFKIDGKKIMVIP
jgi:ferric-dicitrate binding protein FerR (iron transport regulator)